ncbi:NAD(P)H-binding protein [Amycolatopsis suaedae]|uniref:NAD(P)H-binding protein n=1 Tax=Amycolatopsis suaedae TaxID=2510978 RepID=UPI00196A7615|nr:NAD(P)H-binding protein [Amycolatopsis suaedae]
MDVRRADLTRPTTLRPVLDGVDRVFLFPAVAEAATEFMELATGAGVRRVVVLSSEAAGHPRQANLFSVEYHRSVERAVENAGVEWTFLRPSGFAANTLEWALAILAEGVVRTPYPGAAQALIHEADIASVATQALLHDVHIGQTHLMTGPEAITKLDQATAIGKAIGRPIRFAKISPAQWREDAVRFMPDFVADMMLELWAEADTAPEPVYPTVERILGRPALTFARWAEDHAGDFRAHSSAV